MARHRPHRKTARPIRGSAIHGEGKDYHRYYRCVYCGFICDIERDNLGDANSTSGEAYQYDTNPTYGGISVLGGVGHSYVAMEVDPSGDYKTIVRTYKFAATSGCPACGSLNWRGDY